MIIPIILASTLLVATLANPVAQSGGWSDQGRNGGHGPPKSLPDQALRSMPITRTGGELQLAGQKWAGAGANVYWLGLVHEINL